MSRLSSLNELPEAANVLEVGSGAGAMIVALAEAGYRCQGVEPWPEARTNARRLAEHFGTTVDIHEGVAEKLPFADGQFHVVLADSVIEHVRDPRMAFSEAFRVLKPGGVFWFYTASSLCPMQHEIQAFPLFGWYPDGLKRRIMNWAKIHKPQLVGHTETPAIHWFTPWKVRRMLRECGFREVYDRWDLLSRADLAPIKRLVVQFIRFSSFTRLCADICLIDCSYSAVK